MARISLWCDQVVVLALMMKISFYLSTCNLIQFSCARLVSFNVIEPFLRPSQGFWGTGGEKGIYFWGIGEERPNYVGNRGTKTILGNREHKKTKFRFLGNRVTSQFISGKQGNRYPLGGRHF